MNRLVSALKPKSTWFFYIFIACLIPRVILFTVNRDFADNHMEPVIYMAQHGELPDAKDCWECFQPPLFYSAVYGLDIFFKTADHDGMYVLVQAFNIVFSSLLLWLILRLVESFNLTRRYSIAMMLFWGLNPEIVSISVLATNDVLLLFLAFALCYALNAYWKQRNVKTELALFFLLFLVSITKGNGLVFIAGFGLIWAYLKTIDHSWLKIATVRQIGLAALVAVLVAGLGGYYAKHEKYGDAFVTNFGVPGKPNFYTPDDYDGRVGVRTVAEAYFTFPIASLMEDVVIVSHDNVVSSGLRRNLWTQFLGQFSNYLFETYPPSWVSVDNDMYNFSRMGYGLNALLFVLFVGGLVVYLKNTGLTWTSGAIIHTFLVLLFILFVARYSYTYRDFSTMKLIFVFPALYSLITLHGYSVKVFRERNWFFYLLVAAVVLNQISYLYLLRTLM